MAFTGCTHVFYQPDRLMYYPPKKLGFEPRQIDFRSGDGTKLVAWYFPPVGKVKPKGTIIQFHGNAENISSHYTSLVWLTKLGYALFAFDYRGYGGSEGEPSPEGVYKDGMAALDKAWELRVGRRFIVFGQSLGGAIAARAFDDFGHRGETSLVVLDSTFSSYKRVARRVLASHWVTWVLSPLAHVLVSDRFSSEEALGRLRTRLLVIHDQRDPAVPFACGEEVFAEAVNASKKEFWKLSDGRHIEALAPYNLELREKFVSLLETLQ